MSTPGLVGRIAAVWGVAGIVVLLVRALWRLTPIALEPVVGGSLSLFQAVVYGLWVLINAHAEGYRGFHCRFAPRVVARARWLARHPSPMRVLAAPAFCMSLFHASRRGLIVAYCVLGGIVVLVLAVRSLPQPWRGIVDGGVVVGLSIGLASLLYYAVRAIVSRPVAFDPDLPPTGR